MASYEFAVLYSTYRPVHQEAQWETVADLPSERRDFAGAGAVAALNELGADGWRIVGYDQSFPAAYLAPAAPANTHHVFWLQRDHEG